MTLRNTVVKGCPVCIDNPRKYKGETCDNCGGLFPK